MQHVSPVRDHSQQSIEQEHQNKCLTPFSAYMRLLYWRQLHLKKKTVQAGMSEANTPGGDSPGLPTGRPTIDQQQLNSMLSIHGLRDVANDD